MEAIRILAHIHWRAKQHGRELPRVEGLGHDFVTDLSQVEELKVSTLASRVANQLLGPTLRRPFGA